MDKENSPLTLTPEYFKILIDTIQEVFLEKHRIKKIPKTFQLYGYGNFEEDKPNLKEDFEEISGEFINGKYLYNKTRELKKGRPVIKINKFYKSLLLEYIGFKNFQEFIAENRLSEEETEKQLSLLEDKSLDKTYYFLNYYFGEDNIIIKGRTVISDNWKRIQHTYIYRQEDGSHKMHYNFGTIYRREDTIHISTKTLLNNKLVHGANEVYYIGHDDPSSANFLVGVYCAFDIYTNTVAGTTILEKCSSKEEMEEKSKSNYIPPYIAQEIRNKRIINRSVVPKTFLEISENSPYAYIYNKIAGSYNLVFDLDDGRKETFKFKILKTNFKIIPLVNDVFLEWDNIELLNKGSVIHLSFELAGIIALSQVQIYFKTHYLKEGNPSQEGVFNGIDDENRLIKGNVLIEFFPDNP